MLSGFTSTSFRQIRDPEKIVRIAKQADAECIEWGGDIHVKNLSDAQRVKRLCDEEGIRICSYGSYYRVGSKIAAQWERICEITRAMNGSSVRVWLGDKDSERTSEAEYASLAEDTHLICETAKQYALTVCPECHDGTFNNRTDAFLKLKHDIGAENLKTYFQSRYKRLAYDLDRIERTLPYIESVHISFSEQTREQLPRHDATYIDQLLKKLIGSGFDGNLLIEYTALFSYMGIPRCMVRDMQKIKEKTNIMPPFPGRTA